jgi:ferric-dicitrate binding protein FerR (iron transport regulator)
MAAVDAGTLDEASRLRLLDHLESCPSCASRQQGIARIVEALRSEEVNARPERLQQLWRRTLAGTSTRAAAPLRRLSRPRLLLAAGLGLAVLVAGAFAVLTLRPRAPAPTARIAAGAARWQALSLPEVGGPRAGSSFSTGDRLEVRDGGRAVLASASELVSLRGGTTLSFVEEDGAPVLRLERGRISARSIAQGVRPERPAPGAMLIRAGAVRVRPLGTAFSVQHDPPVVTVLVVEGKVEVVPRAGVTMVLSPGQSFRGGAPGRLAEAERRELEAELGRAADALAPRPVRPATAPATPGPGPERPAERSFDDELRAIERLLARGLAVQARTRAARLLERAPSSHAPLLQRLIAESHVRERRYREARDAYLRTFTRFAGTAAGAEGLFMAGSLELDQLARPREAVRRFERYLSSYRKGRQREEAHYLLCRALLAVGERERARRAAASYLAEFPEGRYRASLEPMR